MIEIKPAAVGLSAEVEPILRALPQWFGIEEATVFYIQQADENPTFLAIDSAADDRPVGFLTLYTHSPFASEISVMAVLPEYHRQGVGRALLTTAEAQLRDEGVIFL